MLSPADKMQTEVDLMEVHYNSWHLEVTVRVIMQLWAVMATIPYIQHSHAYAPNQKGKKEKWVFRFFGGGSTYAMG